MRRRYVWDPELKELVEITAEPATTEHHHFVRGDISEFASPIDGSRIGSRSALRKHMKTHGVILQSEMCPKEMSRKSEERRQMVAGTHPSQKAARIEALRGAFERTRNEARAKRRFG